MQLLEEEFQDKEDDACESTLGKADSYNAKTITFNTFSKFPTKLTKPVYCEIKNSMLIVQPSSGTPRD